MESAPFALDFATLEHFLLKLFKLSPQHRSALVGRFKYLKKLLGDSGDGTRHRARYDLEDVLKIAYLFELEDAGIPPMLAVRMVLTDWDHLRTDFAYAWRAACEHAEGNNSPPLAWAMILNNLAELGAYDGMLDVPVTGQTGGLDPHEVQKWPSERNPLDFQRHTNLVYLPLILAASCESLRLVAPGQLPAFRSALDQFAEELTDPTADPWVAGDEAPQEPGADVD